MGEPEWGFSLARHFAELGMIGAAAQYRLSDQKSITPLDAMADARAVIRWMRANADSLGIDGNRIAAYGWSAGAQQRAPPYSLRPTLPMSSAASLTPSFSSLPLSQWSATAGLAVSSSVRQIPRLILRMSMSEAGCLPHLFFRETWIRLRRLKGWNGSVAVCERQEIDAS